MPLVVTCGVIWAVRWWWQQQHRGGGSERQKSTLYIEKYINLRSIITTNTPDKHQKGFLMRLHAAERPGWLVSTQGGFFSKIQ